MPLRFAAQAQCKPLRLSRTLTCAPHGARQYTEARRTALRSSMAGDAASGRTLQPANAIDFLTLLHNLKSTKRTGWVKRGVPQPESIADHMYRMSMMGLICGADAETTTRCIKLAIVHDVAEAIVGDITPHDGVSDADKFSLEATAVQRMRSMLGTSVMAGEEIEELWHEYEQAQTPAAQLVKDFDKLEMILQAQEYEGQDNMQLDEFFASTDGKWRTELGRMWAAEIVSRRKQSNRVKSSSC